MAYRKEATGDRLWRLARFAFRLHLTRGRLTASGGFRMALRGLRWPFLLALTGLWRAPQRPLDAPRSPARF